MNLEALFGKAAAKVLPESGGSGRGACGRGGRDGGRSRRAVAPELPLAAVGGDRPRPISAAIKALGEALAEAVENEAGSPDRPAVIGEAAPEPPVVEAAPEPVIERRARSRPSRGAWSR